MAKGVKIAAGTILALGAVGGIAYIFRQKKLLKNICVYHTDIGWEATLYDIASSMQAGTAPTLEMPFQLTLVNNSNIDVTVKEVDMSITWLTTGTSLLTSDQLIANIYSARETILNKKSETTLTINVDLSPLAQLSSGQLAILAADVNSLTGNGIDVLIQGNIKLKASIFETVNYPYYLRMNTAEGLSTADEQSGDCKKE